MREIVWLSSLSASQQRVQAVTTSLESSGFEVDGHLWDDNLDTMAWCRPRKELLDRSVRQWLIHGDGKMLARPAVRYGLSLLALTVQASRGLDFPITILQDGETAVVPEFLPTPLSECPVLAAQSTTCGAEIAARIHEPQGLLFPPYRLDTYGIPRVGQWFEVGPRKGEWNGVIFATAGAGISLHAVGLAGRLPERSTLRYPQQGLKLTVGGREFDGWAVQNHLDGQSSYFVKVESHPEAIMFCPYTREDETDAFVIRLQ